MCLGYYDWLTKLQIRHFIRTMADIAQCPLCQVEFSGLEEVKLPKLLSCEHTICTLCVSKLPVKAILGEAMTVECTICQQVTHMDLNTGCPTNVALLEFLESMQKKARDVSRSVFELKIPCDLCHVADSEEFCKGCNAYMCRGCRAVVHVTQAMRRHEITPLPGKPQPPVPQPVVHPPPAPVKPQKKCPNHGHNAELFCIECNDFLCPVCLDDGKHNPHTVDIVENVAGNFKRNLEGVLPQVEHLQFTMMDCSEKLRTAKEKLLESEAKAKALNLATFQELEKIIVAFRDKIAEELTAFTAENIAKLETQEEEIVTCTSELTAVTRDVQNVVHEDSFEKILSSYQNLNNQVEGALTKGNSFKNFSVKSSDTFQMFFDVKSVEKALKNCASMVQLEAPIITTHIPSEVTFRYFEVCWDDMHQSDSVQYEAELAKIEEKQDELFYTQTHFGNIQKVTLKLEYDSHYSFRVRSLMDNSYSPWTTISLKTRNPAVKFSNSRNSTSIEVSAGGSKASKTSIGYTYAFCEDSFTGNEGEFSWRVRVAGQTLATGFGVSNSIPADGDGFYSKQGVWHVFSNGQVYLETQSSSSSFRCQQGDIVKISLNLSTRTVTIQNVSKPCQHSFSIPNDGTWHPSFHICSKGSIEILEEVN
jgi:hypothetical protein